MTQITKNLDTLNKRIQAACKAAGRNENEVSVLAVSKRHSTASIGDALAAGLCSMGENYLQEALEKIAVFDDTISWHFIGRIQANKTRAIAENFQWAQTVSSERIARRLNDQRPDELAPLNICVQMSTNPNDTHGGIAPQAAASLCQFIETQPRLKLRGLMTIPLPTDTTEQQRIPFRQARELHAELIASGHKLDTLSMGMTNDLEAAIIEGSTMIRIGTALFGPRPG